MVYDPQCADLLDFYAVIYALEDSSVIPQDKMEHIRRDIAAFLNTRPGQYTDKELADQAAALKAKYPEIRDLVSTAYASDGVAGKYSGARPSGLDHVDRQQRR